jgi:cyclopropane-fatty-acyl-phospholipid synthase
MSLEEAQRAKIDLALGKCALRPGLRLLDIGCGWGATVRRAVEAHGCTAIGLTLSRNQHRFASRALADLPQAEIRLQDWEEFDEPVDRIVSIGAFEHFRVERHARFFERCRRPLPPDGRMLLHTIVQHDFATLAERGIDLRHEDVLFAKFIRRRIFPGGQLCPPGRVVDHARRAGVEVLAQQSLQPHYARTLDLWAARLAAARTEAVALTSEENYDAHMRYLTGCARYFRSGHIDVVQFTLDPSRAPRRPEGGTGSPP